MAGRYVMLIIVCSRDVPPAFKTKESSRDEEVDGGIYYKSAVAGFVSLMVDASRKMMCYTASGCENAALICFLSEPTLVEGKRPIRWALKFRKETLRQENLCSCL